MGIDEFIDILAERQLVSASVAQKLRERVHRQGRPVSPPSLLKYLVKKELITRTQAQQLLETTLSVSPSAESSILGLGSLQPQLEQAARTRGHESDDDIPTLKPVDQGAASETTDLREDEWNEEDARARSVKGFVEAAWGEVPDDARKIARDVKETKNKKRGKQNEFDSPLLLLGGGGLIVLILVGVVIGYLLSREDADAVLAEAAEYYDSGSYTQAVSQYDKFVTGFPRHPEISAAKVRLGLARIWKAASGSTQFSPALETAKEVLDQIEDEKEFESAKRDLSSLLMNIAQGLAAQAENASDPEDVIRHVGEATEALALCNNTKFVPTTFRDDIKIAEIQETLDRVRRRQQQQVNLGEGLKDIQEAVDAGNTAEAYAIYNKLVEDNPGLLNDQSLVAKLREISAAERDVVKFVSEERAAETTPRETNVVAELVLAGRSGPPANVTGTAAVRAGGAIYVVDVNSGAVLWRHFVGDGPALPAVALESGDLLVVDSGHHELLRLEAATGKLVWRQAFDSPILAPVVMNDRLLVTEKSGKLHLIETQSGQRMGYVEFGQPLPVPPVVAPRGNRIYAVGEHSSLYSLGADDLACVGVFYLGQESGSIAVAPVCVLDKVVVAENSGLETSNLHVLSRGEADEIAAIDVSRRLTGLVTTPLLVDGRRLVALTTLGQTSVFEIGSESGSDALTQLASRDPESGPPVARFGLLHEGQVWTAGNQLNKMVVLPTENRLQLRDIDHDYSGDTFDYPLQAVGGVVIHVRHPQGRGGVLVGAMEAESGRALWQTELAVPLSGAPAVDTMGPRISAITTSGAAYLLDRQAMTRRVQDQAERLPTAPELPPLAESVDLGQGRMALSSAGAKSILHFRPAAPRSPLTAVTLSAALSCPLVAWDGAFVAPTRVGQIYLFDGETAEQIGSPFQPPLEPGEDFQWLPPAVYGAGADSRLVLSDGVAMVYLVARSTEPEPHLKATAEAPVSSSPLTTRLAVMGDVAYAGTQAGELARFALPSLEQQPGLELGAKITWGPFTIGDRLLVATANDELVSVSGAGEIEWRKPLAHGQPCGHPLADGAGVLILWQKGGLTRVASTDGAETTYLELEQPVLAGPVAFGNRVLLAAADGTLLVVNRPGQPAE